VAADLLPDRPQRGDRRAAFVPCPQGAHLVRSLTDSENKHHRPATFIDNDGHISAQGGKHAGSAL
jgi:hypothetical protein